MALCLVASQILGSSAMAPIPGSPGYVPPPQPPAGTMKAAGCSPASQITQLSVNNVRAVIENGGNMWTQRGLSQSGYEVPKTEDFTGPNSIYAGALWMGGVSPDNQLKIAAVLYRADGNDFWPGPLNVNDASVTADVCQTYDRFWQTSRTQAETHVQYHNCINDPDCIVEELFPDGYTPPTSFLQWPAIGNVAAGQDLYLAPFVDANNDLFYNPTDGDYPDYGFNLTVEDCLNKQREDPVPLFGDDNIYWIFNDKGDAHTESLGQPIGLEVRAQAFSFNSNNEINNMTFYNYVVINQGTQTLTNTYFGHFVDPDLGCSNDDYAGCDVQRGLGFVYNWDNEDVACLGNPGYGGPNPPPPAIGVDFFEGPFQDADNIDNPGPAQGLSCQEYQEQGGIPYKGLGIGYGDGVNDNERFGMRAYIYFNREGNTNLTDPSTAPHYYNYLRSIWKNNVPQSYGGNGYNESNATRAFYMFPWNSDPVGWGTDCVPQATWQEETQSNLVDRRFVQSAGPFTLEPGAYNNVTVGVVWARAANGNNITSVELLRIADDKAQALFDNCFKILDGPDAPDLEITELDRQLILHIVNPPGSNNENEAYLELDPIIPETDTANNPYDRYYRFQGYLVYQLSDATVSVSDLADPNRARLIYQGDVQDGIGQIINFNYNADMDQTIPTEMVNGADEGIVHSISVTQDAFAQGSPALVNFKTYYFLAVSYAYNNYEDFDIATGMGQPFLYVPGRKAAFGAIRPYSGIPHKPAPQNGGTIQTAQFGDMLPITRIEGQGNGGNVLELEQASVNEILASEPWRKDQISYVGGRGPIEVRVVDPLAVPDAQFEVWIHDDTPDDLNNATWSIVKLSPDGNETIESDRSIEFNYDQLILDWGLSVTVDQTFYQGSGVNKTTRLIGEGIL
ncbi:MAG: T9SS C-terminal target domain-containing protein, partial [Bacteroidota bacterium]|nr:T9SS C-terminal target domain-containing protein [Bacteroidota bacterium]